MAEENEALRPEPARLTAEYHKIYCGPTLPARYALSQYQVFKGGLPAHVAALCEECPAIEGLIVPVADLADTRLALAKKGTPESALYEQIRQHFAKG